MQNKIKDVFLNWKNKFNTYKSKLNIEQKLKKPEGFIGNIDTWPKMAAVVLLGLFLLYYPLGALISENIDTTTSYDIVKYGQKSATIDTISFLIKREVYQKSWTPALPFVFPASLLDNMPAFQLGEISAMREVAKAFVGMQNKDISIDENTPLNEAQKLLQYPGTIWMFSPTNKLLPVPSSNSQYRKSKKQLDKYNNMLQDGRAFLAYSKNDLGNVLRILVADVFKSSKQIENHVREYSSAWIDNEADDVFYFQKGKMYAYCLLLKAMGHDFKETLLQNELYALWTALQRTVEDAVLLAPSIVRNAKSDGITSANHLMVMNYYTVKSAMIMQRMLEILSEQKNNGETK